MKKEKINLLIVDDEEMFLESIAKRLKVRDFDVITVTRGEKALEVADKYPIDVAIVDLKMPGMNGEETLAALKKKHNFMEIVILTGHGSIDSAVKCTQEGAYSYLQKPCDFDQLLDVLVEAYKKCVMKRNKIKEEHIQEIIEMAKSNSPLSILQKIKEYDKGES